METERSPAKSSLRPVLEANWSQSQIRQATWWARRATRNGNLSLAELDDRIAILRDNLRQLIEQAAAASGSQNEERIADRIAQQTQELDKLILERDSRAKKYPCLTSHGPSSRGMRSDQASAGFTPSRDSRTRRRSSAWRR